MYVAPSNSNAWYYHTPKRCNISSLQLIKSSKTRFLLLAPSGHIGHVTPAEMKVPDRVQSHLTENFGRVICLLCSRVRGFQKKKALKHICLQTHGAVWVCSAGRCEAHLTQEAGGQLTLNKKERLLFMLLCTREMEIAVLIHHSVLLL